MTVIQSRSEAMSGYQLDMGEVQSPASDYSYTKANTMSSTSGIFPFSQTGPTDPSGSAWDTTTAEGSQNFFANQGDAEEYSFTLGHMTTRTNQTDPVENFQPTWAVQTATDTKIHKAEPMRRISSRGSAGAHRIMKTPGKTQSRMLASASQGTSTRVSKFDMAGNAPSFQERPLGNTHMMDVSQYILQEQNGMSSSPEMTGPVFYPGFSGAADGMTYFDSAMNQHVDPATIPLDFDTSVSGSPTNSWDNFSDGSSPARDDLWHGMALPLSPPTTNSSPSPPLQSLDSFSLGGNVASQPIMSAEDLGASMTTVIGDDQFSMPPGWNARRLVNEGETARDHPLYKNAFPQPDGLFHCPWEGQASCNHKAEKLKCNYDKFVDSHLKPYRCKIDSCENARFSSTACLLRHEREAHAMHGHGDKPYLCTYEGCDRALPGNGFPRNWNLRDHMRRVHNDNGTTAHSRAVSPPPTGNSQKEVKPRKRKSDASKSTSGRKSPKSIPVVDEDVTVKAEKDATAKLRAEWFGHQNALPDLMNSFPQMDDPMVLDHIRAFQERLEAMSRLSQGLISKKNPGFVQPYNQIVQQSG